MNILIFHSDFLDGNRENIYVYNLAKKIKKEGHRAVILSQENRLMDDSLVDRIYEYTYGNKFKRMTYKSPVSSGGECILIKYAGECPAFNKNTDINSFNNCVYNALKNILLEMDIGLFISSALLPEAWIIEHIRKEVPQIRHYSLIDEKSFYEYYKKNKNFKDYFTLVFSKASKLIFKNKALFKDILNDFSDYKHIIEEKSQIVTPGIDADLFKPSLLKERDLILENLKYKLSNENRNVEFIERLKDKEKLSLLTYGDLSPVKGLPLLVYMFPFIRESIQGLNFYIPLTSSDKMLLQIIIRDLSNANEESIKKNLKKFALEFAATGSEKNYYEIFLHNLEDEEFLSSYLTRAKGIDRQIFLLDYLPHSTLSDLINLSDLTVFSPLNENYFSVSVLESLASGKIVAFPRNRAMEDLEETISDIYINEFALEGYRHLYLNDRLLDDLLYNILLLLNFSKENKEKDKTDLVSDSLSQKTRWKYSWTFLFDEIFR